MTDTKNLKYVDIFTKYGEFVGSRLASHQCQTPDEHQDCSNNDCDCPCHDGSGLFTADRCPAERLDQFDGNGDPL